MFEICVIIPSRRSSLLTIDTLLEARETASETAAMTGCEVEIVNHETGMLLNGTGRRLRPDFGGTIWE